MDPDFKTATPKSTPKFSRYMNDYGTSFKRDSQQVQFQEDDEDLENGPAVLGDEDEDEEEGNKEGFQIISKNNKAKKKVKTMKKKTTRRTKVKKEEKIDPITKTPYLVDGTPSLLNGVSPIPKTLIQTLTFKETEGGHNKETLRRYLYMILEGGWHPWDTIFNQFILFCVFLNIFCFVILTEEKIHKMESLRLTVLIVEGFTIGVFTLEYILRVYISIERKSLRRLGRFCGRIRYMFRIMPLMDLLAIIPYPAIHIIHAIHPNLGENSSSILRVFGVLRLFKLEKYTHMGSAIYEVIKYHYEVLKMSFAIGFVLLILTSTLLFYAEKDANRHYFPSIAGSMYTSIMILCGQGTPWDVNGQITKTGYFIIAMSTAISVGFFALPASILVSGFSMINEHLVRRRRKKLLVNAGSESDTTDEEDESYLFFTGTHESDEEGECPHCNKIVTKLNKPKKEKLEKKDKVQGSDGLVLEEVKNDDL